jgi:glyoxylase-like metal-dependent hydrolase (beta-lactamase superfamily II)/rhodanese-related sulfurtransferase
MLRRKGWCALILKQFYLPCLAHASYVIGDEQTGTAVVVDPQRDTDQYVAFAAENKLTIKHVFLTHLHADFVAGHLELRDRAGAGICLGAAAKAEYAFTPFRDDDVLEFGRVRLKVLETPGHTPESISILVYNLSADEAQPHAVLTGETLFIGDVGRPDLRAALGWSAAQLGSMLFDSLHTKLLALPDQCLVYPAHGAGSLCGTALSKETFSTLGEQRRSNYALQPMSREAFIAVVTADQPDAPAYFNYDAVLNSQERPTLDAALAKEMQPLPLERVLELQEQGAQVLDTRDPAEFAAAHLAGSINVGLGGQYATWVGTVLDRTHPIVIIATPGRENEAAVRLGRIGFDHVAGYLEDGLHSLKSRPDLTRDTERLSAPFAAECLSWELPPILIDIRTPRERQQKHIVGSVSIPLNHLLEKLEQLPKDRPLLVYCAGGYRSSIAASLLQTNGFPLVSEIAGGLAGWEAQLAAGVSRADVVRAFLRSPEGAGLAADSLYVGYFHRSGGAGSAGWIAALQSGSLTYTAMSIGFLTSAENSALAAQNVP